MINNKKGHIVTVASLAGHSGTNKLVDYCSSKFANVGMDEALKAELFVQGYSSFIKTTVVCPYYISTGMFEGVASKVNSFKLKISLRILVRNHFFYYVKFKISNIFDFQVVPILEPEYVAEETVKAILMNKPVLILPWWCTILVTLKTVLQTDPYIKLAQTFGFNCSMDQFSGRNNNNKIENIK